MKAKKNIILAFFLLMSSLLLSSSCNKFTMFEDYYVAFDIIKSSPRFVSAKAAYTSDYYLHLCSSLPAEPVEVELSFTAGDGLKQGVDYEIVRPANISGNKTVLKFLPGIYEQKITIKWLPHELDDKKDNTLTLNIESASGGIIQGLPGPDAKNRSIKITKTSK